MPKIGDKFPKPKLVCKACGGSGKNTKGRPCHPCVARGRIKQ